MRIADESGRVSLPPGLPALDGKRIRLRFRPSLTAHRGKLLSRRKVGIAVHAGAFLQRRLIVLDESLLENRRELARILVHELFHFVWARLGNSRRRSYEQMLEREMRSAALGELGWSAELMKGKLTVHHRRLRTPLWRAYACESFCDTAGWLFARVGRHSEHTLGLEFRAERRVWFQINAAGSSLPV